MIPKTPKFLKSETASFALFLLGGASTIGAPLVAALLLGRAGMVAAPAVLISAASACTPATLSTVDLVGRSASRVLGWCEQSPGADPSRLERARRAIEEKDLVLAAATLHEAVAALRERGAEPPPEVASAEVLLGALAAEAIQDGMRALSEPSASP